MGKSKTTSSTTEATKPSLLQQIQDSTDAALAVRDVSFDDLLAEMQAAGELLDATQLGDGYHLLQGKEEKKKLVGVPMIVVDWNLNPGRWGGFATLHVKTGAPVFFDGTAYSHFIINDGGTGIRRQLKDLIGQNKGLESKMILLRQGLRVSEDYEVMEDYTDENGDTQQRPVIDPSNGKPVLGTTFYLDTSL